MSLILDALNKADKERQNTDSAPGINTSHEPPQAVKTQLNWLYLSLAGLALVLLLVFVLFFLADEKESAAPAAVKVEQSTKQVNKAAPPTETAAPTQRSTATIPGLPKPMRVKKPGNSNIKPSVKNKAEPPVKVQQNVGSLYQQEESTTPPSKEKKAPRVNPIQQEKKPAPHINTASQERDPPGTKSPFSDKPAEVKPRPPVTTNIAKPAELAPQKPEELDPNSLAAYKNTVDMSELPWSVQSKIPTLRYTTHTYREDGNSRVTINENNVRQGGRIGSGVVIEKILVDGLVLKYDNHTFKMQALNSWINL